MSDEGCKHGHVGACTACQDERYKARLRERIAELERENKVLHHEVSIAVGNNETAEAERDQARADAVALLTTKVWPRELGYRVRAYAEGKPVSFEAYVQKRLEADRALQSADDDILAQRPVSFDARLAQAWDEGWSARCTVFTARNPYRRGEQCGECEGVNAHGRGCSRNPSGDEHG